MWLIRFYRLFVALGSGTLVYLLLFRSVWALLGTLFGIRFLWFYIERQLRKHTINRRFNQHAYAFKQLFGPYGIRLINKAESDWPIKKSLSEVFVSNEKTLASALETLEVLETLHKAGMSPAGDDYLLHDLKIKYAKHRLGSMEK